MTTKSGAINRAMITRDGLTAAYRCSYLCVLSERVLK